MSAESSIILVANNDNIAQILRPKLVLLREIDTISTSDYSGAIPNIKACHPDTILIHCAEEKQDCLDLIKLIKSDESTKDTSILLIIDDYNQDFILSAYDEDISDYLSIKADDAEILMRTIWCLKKNALIKTAKKQRKLLEQLNVINQDTGFYASKFCDKVFENELAIISKTQQEDEEDMIMAISPSEESKTKLDPNDFAKAIKNSTRNSDIIIHGASNKFYILLPKTPLKGVFCVWDKIKNAVGEENTINAGVSNFVGKSVEELKKELLNALIEAESTKNDLVVVNNEEEETSSSWLDKINSSQKNFKLFKQAFSKKLDKVITPIFFQMQKLYEEKLFETKIEQYSNSTLSSFSLKKSDSESELKITYPGFSKINIDIVHQGLDSPENRRISLDLTELDETKLTQILENFIREFKTVNG